MKQNPRNVHNASSALLAGAMALSLTACLAGDEPEFQVTEVGSVISFVEGESTGTPLDERIDRLPEPEDAGTQLHEPGNGYFIIDYDSPETTEYYSDCEITGTPVPPTDMVYQTEVDAENNMWRSYSVVIREVEGVERILPNGEIGLVGDRYINQECEYTSSFANCSADGVVIFDLADLPFLPPGTSADAQVKVDQQFYVYFDYGQESYRTLVHSNMYCEGADCDGFWVDLFFGQAECSAGGMTKFKRIETPEVSYD